MASDALERKALFYLSTDFDFDWDLDLDFDFDFDLFLLRELEPLLKKSLPDLAINFF